MPEQLPELDNSYRFRYFDWEKAKTFYYVAKLGSFTKAAEFLSTFQPSLSRQIASLENHLGCPLLMRTARGVQMTRKGEELFALVENTFLGFKGFTTNTHVELNKRQERKIRISTTHALTTHVLCEFIFDYTKQNPHIRFELLGNDHLIDVLLNDVDIAIRPLSEHRGDKTFNQTTMKHEYLFSLEKILYASEGYLEKYGEPQTVEDLRNHRLIVFGHPEEHPYADINWILKLGMEAGKIQEPYFISNSIECMIEAAKNDMGIVANYKEMKIVKESNLKNILPKVKDKEVKWYFIYPEFLKEDQEVIKVKSYLKERIQKLNLL